MVEAVALLQSMPLLPHLRCLCFVYSFVQQGAMLGMAPYQRGEKDMQTPFQGSAIAAELVMCRLPVMW